MAVEMLRTLARFATFLQWKRNGGGPSGTDGRAEQSDDQDEEWRAPSQQICPWACCLHSMKRGWAAVVRILAAEAVQTLIIKVLRAEAGDLLEAGCRREGVEKQKFEERYSRQILFRGIGAEGQRRLAAGASCDCGMRSDRVGAGVIAGARRRGNACGLSIAIMWRPAICSGSRCSRRRMQPNRCPRRLPRHERLQLQFGNCGRGAGRGSGSRKY